MRGDRPDTKCIYCEQALHWAELDDGTECYVTDTGHESCPDPLQDDTPFEHEPLNGLNWT